MILILIILFIVSFWIQDSAWKKERVHQSRLGVTGVVATHDGDMQSKRLAIPRHASVCLWDRETHNHPGTPTTNIMAGCGRRTGYRKHLTDSVLQDLPEPSESQEIAQVVATRGGNQFEIKTTKVQELALLPTKFHKVVWVKRNDYVIVERGDNNEEGGGGGIRYMIQHILYKDQIKHLKSKNLWPIEFSNDEDDDTKTKGNDEKKDQENGGIVYDQGYSDMDELVANTNRALRIQDPDSESDSDEE